MARTTPRVEGATLVDPAAPQQAIAVGTPPWYAWLQRASTFAFVSSAGRFTARKERRGRADGYWRAYRKQAGMVRGAYLGKTVDLTSERLNAVAALLAGPASVGDTQPVAGPAAPLAEPSKRVTSGLPTGTVTFLFTDIEGSTQQWEQEPAAMQAALPRHDTSLRDAIAAHGGSIFKTMGDGVHAGFATTPAAVAAALAAQQLLHAEPWALASPMRVRMALHTGVAELRNDDYFGPVLNRLVRLLAAGHGGQILLSLAAEALVREHLPAGAGLRDLGVHSLKDLQLPEQIFQLISPDLPASFPPLRIDKAHSPATFALPLLATKLAIPPARDSLVARPRLLARVTAGVAGKLTLLAAPAGFGKTTLLASWLAAGTEDQGLRTETVASSLSPQSSALGTRVAWLSLDGGDNDPAAFVRYLVAALRQATATPLGAMALALLESPQPPPLTTLLLTLINELASLRLEARDVRLGDQMPNHTSLKPHIPSLILVLDDYHAITTPAIHEAIASWIDHMPATLHLLIASREDPPLPLARLRARGEVTEVRAADLRFTPDETAMFLRDVMGQNLTAADIAALESRTEGWIAGLQLAALAMRDRADQPGFIATFTGNNRFIIDYLASEVLDRLQAHLRTFLLQTAILKRMCGSLCDAVLGVETSERSDVSTFQAANARTAYSQIILDQIERANLFLIPLDHERHWYRYHPLFADVLRKRLSRGVPAAELATLHQRASRWFERENLLAEAVEHALAAGMAIEHAGMNMALDGQGATVAGWLAQLPGDSQPVRPRLALIQACVEAFRADYDAAATHLGRAEAGIAALGAEQAALLRGEIAALRAVAAGVRGAPDAIALGRQALDELPASHPLRIRIHATGPGAMGRGARGGGATAARRRGNWARPLRNLGASAAGANLARARRHRRGARATWARARAWRARGLRPQVRRRRPANGAIAARGDNFSRHSG